MGKVGGGRAERIGRIVALAGACLCLLLAACSSGSTSTTQTGTATGTAVAGAATTPAGSGTQAPQPTYTPINGGTPGAVLGTGDYCASKPDVSASLPSNIPTYPGAQMLLGQIQGNTGVFALCSGDSVQTVDAFYAAQLPAKNWQQITNTQVTTSEQFTACTGQCGSVTPVPGSHATNLIITIEPDTSNGYQTQIEILYSGS